MKSIMAVSLKHKNKQTKTPLLTILYNNDTPESSSQRNKNYVHTKNMYMIIHSNFIYNSLKLEPT